MDESRRNRPVESKRSSQPLRNAAQSASAGSAFLMNYQLSGTSPSSQDGAARTLISWSARR